MFRRYILIILLSLFTGLLSSCYQYVTDKGNGETISMKCEINISSEDSPSYDDCQIVTLADEHDVPEGVFDVLMLNNTSIQPVIVMSVDNHAYLMAREIPGRFKTLYINEETTALAIVTMHPLLAPLKGADYEKVVQMVNSSAMWEPFKAEVEKTIIAKRDIFDPENEVLLLALNNLFESIAERINDEIDYSDSLEDITGSETLMTRAIYENPKVYPLHAEISGNTLTLRNVGLTPSYYGQVNEASGVVTPFSVPSRSDYGGMDLFKENLDEFMLGDPRIFRFSATGNYNFHLSRMGEAAQADFWLRLANAVLSSIGVEIDGSLMEVANMISRAMINANSGVNDALTDPMDWIGIAYEAVLDWAQEDYWETIGKGGIIRVGNILASSLNFYNKIKGIFNASMRLAHMLAAPEEINFCLCYRQDRTVTACTKTSLYIVEGDDQTGYKGQRLLLPLTVYVQTLDEDGNYLEAAQYNRVKYEVVSGGGSVQDEFVSVGNDSQASTYWTLGDAEEQSVKAVAVDLVTGEEISDPVYFSASLEHAQITIRLDWSKHSGNTDIDLHVVDPDGEKIYFGHMSSASGGYLDRDDVVGPGPEHVRWTDAPAGVYKIYVHYYPNGEEDRSVTRYTVSVNADGVTYAPESGSIAYDQYVPVGQFRIGENPATRTMLNLEQTGSVEKPSIPRKD